MDSLPGLSDHNVEVCYWLAVKLSRDKAKEGAHDLANFWQELALLLHDEQTRRKAEVRAIERLYSGSDGQPGEFIG